MKVYHKNIVIQSLLFAAFIVLGLNVMANYLLSDIANWYSFIVLGIAIGFIAWIIVLFRKPDKRLISIHKKTYDQIKYLLYAYFAVYVLYIIEDSLYANSDFLQSIGALTIAIVITVVLVVVATIGLLLQLKVLKEADDK